MLNALLAVDGGLIALIVGIVVLLLGIIVLFWWISTRNGFVVLKNKVEEAWATIDVYLKKRFDLIPNLVETVKGYAKHESETLDKVVSARNLSLSAQTQEAKMEAANQLTGSLRTFFSAVAENYPDLKANTNFLNLQNELKDIESELESARRYYNGVVKSFNTKLEIFPDNIVANGLARNNDDYKKRAYFEVDDVEERKNVKVSF